jgi:hypothetical protein
MFEGKEVQDKVQKSVDKALQLELEPVPRRISREGAGQHA